MGNIGAWLESLGLDEYVELFRENAIDVEILPELDDVHLKELGIPLGHRLRLLKAIAALRPAPPGSPEVPGESVASSRHEAERRPITVMFCDLVGSTRLSQRMDPEDLRDVMSACQDAWKEAIERYDGYIARFMGDGVLAYFGYPTAHEDDAERAVRAGLGVVAAMSSLNQRYHDIDVAVRVGVATGPVVAGDLIGAGASLGSVVVGETPNLAARLQARTQNHCRPT